MYKSISCMSSKLISKETKALEIHGWRHTVAPVNDSAWLWLSQHPSPSYTPAASSGGAVTCQVVSVNRVPRQRV